MKRLVPSLWSIFAAHANAWRKLSCIKTDRALPLYPQAAAGGKVPTDDEKLLERYKDSKKITVRFRAAGGNTPIMKRNKFKVKASSQFSSIIASLRKMLKLKPSASLFIYCAQSFAPSPDETVSDLYNCFQLQNELVLNYCSTDCWG